MIGPVQVLVVGFDRPAFSGEVLAELARLREAGIVRLIDLLLVERAEDGTLETLDVAPDGVGGALGGLAAAVLGRTGGEAEVDVDVRAAVDVDVAVGDGEGDAMDASAWSLAQAVPVGSTAAVALIEHLWARPLAEVIRRAGGTPLEETWLAPRELETLEALIGVRRS